MAEVFGLAAAGIGVAPIAFELAKTVSKLKQFCQDVKFATDDVQHFVDEVDAVHAVLLQLEGLDLLECPSSSPALQRCHSLCAKANGTLSSLATELQAGLRSHGRRTQLTFPFKKDRMKQHTDKLASAKSTLTLACNVYLLWQSKLQAQLQQRMVTEVYATIQAQRDEHSKRFEDLLSGSAAMAQSLHSLKGQPLVREQPATVRHTYIFSDAATVMWNTCFLLASSGWKRFFKSYRIVSWEDPASRSAFSGDLLTLQRLICAGKASLHDRDEFGWSLMRKAAFFAHTHVVRWLCQMGASTSADVDEASLILHYYSHGVWLFDDDLAVQQTSEDVQCIAKELDVDIEEYNTLDIARPVGARTFTKPIEKWSLQDAFELALYSISYFNDGDSARRLLEYLRDLIGRVPPNPELWLVRNATQPSAMASLGCCFLLNSNSDRTRVALRTLLKLAIAAGVDPQFGMIECSSSIPREIDIGVKFWLASLAAEGVDLLEYGEVESEKWRTAKRHPARRRLYGLTYGRHPDDWTVWREHPGDGYAGIFWDMIEHPERTVPGAWVGSKDVLWDDRYFEETERVRRKKRSLAWMKFWHPNSEVP